jgi:hypothetical protein
MANTPSNQTKDNLLLLGQFKKFLDIGTNEGLRYEDEAKSRYQSFLYCIDHFEDQSLDILELGTCRSFVDGKYEGCNEDDTKYWNHEDPSKWDWGAGCFSLLFGMIKKNSKITTVDLMKSHIERCKHMMGTLNIYDRCYPVISDSVKFLKETNRRFDLIYLDTGDMHPIKPTCELQLEEAKQIVERDLLNEDGLILIDDVLNGTPREMGEVNNKLGKSELSIPYLEQNGFDVVFCGYQYVLKKRKFSFDHF